jgi:hypothetical protein
MLPRVRLFLFVLLCLALVAGTLPAADLTSSLKKGTPDLKSAGALAFGPEGILFVADPKAGAVFALDTGDNPSGPAAGEIKVEGLNNKIASLLGTEASALTVQDLAVNPASGNVYLSVSRGRGPDAMPVIVKVDRKGNLDKLNLDDVKFAKVGLSNANVQPQRGGAIEAVTDLAYVKGQVIVAGLSNEEFQSNLRAIPFPFTEANAGAGIKIYHGAHGAFETRSPVRSFTPFDIKGESFILAGYQCTPLVKIPLSQLKPGEKVTGVTIAELGNRNRPLDMVVYQKDGKDYVLIANNARGVMKVTTDNIDKIEGITEPVRGGGTAGLPYETIKDLKGVEQLDRLDKENAVVLIRTPDGTLNLQTIALP